MRIAQIKGFPVRNEYPVSKGSRGDYKRIDFYMARDEERLGI